MMATAKRGKRTDQVDDPVDLIPAPRRFDAVAYVKLVRDETLIEIDDFVHLLTDAERAEVYKAQSVHLWRRTGKKQQGYGPMGLPTPHTFVDRGGATPMPRWKRGDLARWAGQTGRLHLVTFLGQQPRYPGRGGQAAVAASRRAADN